MVKSEEKRLSKESSSLLWVQNHHAHYSKIACPSVFVDCIVSEGPVQTCHSRDSESWRAIEVRSDSVQAGSA